MNETRTGDALASGCDFATSAHCLIQMRRQPTGSNNNNNNNNNNATKKRPDEVAKRTRSVNAYELSQDLLDKQLELLERKYGGGARANHAARVIQRAFRRHSMRRKFATISAMAKADQRRLSRRIHSELVDSAWATTTSSAAAASAPSGACSEPDAADDSGTRAEHVIRTNFAALYRELAETVEGARSASGRPPAPRHPMRQSPHHVHFHPHLHHAYQAQHAHYGVYQTHAPDAAQQRYQAGVAAPAAVVSCAGPSPVSHSPYGVHHHHHHHHHQVEQRRAASNSKRVPPEVPRRVSSTLSCKAPGEWPSARAPGSRPHTPSHDGAERRACSLSAEHSTSEDSLDGATGYSNTFWCEGTAAPSGSQASTHVHSSPLPYVTHEPSGAHAVLERACAPASSSACPPATCGQTKLLENMRKRQYRVGLNLFNKKPERGIWYLTQKGFLEASPRAVAKFFITRKGVSKQMIGEYLGNLQSAFNMATLDYFIGELDFAGLDIDEALRTFQTHFRMPGEAQKIERLMEAFGQRYAQCNPHVASRLRNPDTLFVLAFAIIMLNTDLHTPSLKADKRMKLDDFVKNLRGIDDGANIEHHVLAAIYERVKASEFKPGADHVTQVLKVQQSVVGKKPNLVLPHRRLVCYCRLYEVADAGRRERAGLHQREVFLFNDMLVVTKIFSKKKNGVTYSFRQSFQLAGLNVSYFESHHYLYGIRLSQRVDGRSLIMFNARNEHDRAKFCEDLREAILEMDEMEALRIEAELDKQRSAARVGRPPAGLGAPTPASPADKTDGRDNRDSGVADMDHSGCAPDEACTPLTRRASHGGRRDAAARPETNLKRSTLSNSLLDIADPLERCQRRGSVGSLDSGMSVSFQSSTTNSTMSRDSSPKNVQTQPAPPQAVQRARALQHQSSFLGNIFHKGGARAAAAASDGAVAQPAATGCPTPHCTDV